MKPYPEISVLMPNYNGSTHLAESIESILNQTFLNWELLISDDGSTDDSWKIISQYSRNDPHIKAFQSKENLGNPKNRNLLLSLAHPKSKFIAILDSDDVAEPHRLQTQKDFLEQNPSIALVGSAITIINEHGEEQGVRVYPKSHDEIKRQIMISDPFAQPSVMMTHQAINLVGKYDENLARCQDYDLFTRFIKAGLETANIIEPLTKFRIHSDQGKYQNITKAFKYSFLVRNKYLFSKEFFSIKGFCMWGIYLGGYISSFIFPPKMYAWIFNRLFIKK